MIRRILSLTCILACILASGTVAALDGSGIGTFDESITIRGCDNSLEHGQVSGFSIDTLGGWSMSSTGKEYAGDYTLKGRTFNLELVPSSHDSFVNSVALVANQLCGLPPGTLALADVNIRKFSAKLARDRASLGLKLLMKSTLTDGNVTYKLKYIMLADIAFTPTGGGIGGKISGEVLAPDGQIAATTQQNLMASITDFILSPSIASVTGLLPVPNGTPVELVHLSEGGTVDAVLATTTTSRGKYKFNLDKLGHFDAPDLAVRVSDRGVQMRAFLTTSTVDISPVSEATFQLVIDRIMAVPGALLAHFTFDELVTLVGSTDLLTTLETIPAVPGIDATVAAIKNLVAQDSGLTEFLVAASNAGQTDVGPGDVGNLVPLTQGNTWEYLANSSEQSDSYTELLTVTGTMEISNITTTILHKSNTLSFENPYDEYLEKNSSGLYNWGNTDPEDYLTPAVVPYQEQAFPLKLGSTLEVMNLADLEWDEDLDGDGMNERFDVEATITTVGIESVSVPAGTFPNAVKQEILITIDLTLSQSGNHLNATDITTQWLAKDVGQIKLETKTTARVFGRTSTITWSYRLNAYRVDGHSVGSLPEITLLDNLASANSDTYTPGPPAIGTDGSNYLLISCRQATSGEPSGIIVRLVSAGGVLSGEIAIAPNSCETFPGTDVAFDGINYLVTYINPTSISGINELRAVRVSTNGQVIDNNGGFLIYVGESIGSSPKIAFDGSNYLVVWSQFIDWQYDIFGAMVSPDGSVTPRFEVFTASGEQNFPAIAFVGTNYLVVWRDTRTGSGPSDNTDIYGTRVTPAGDVLDPAGIAVVTIAGTQDAPRIAFDGTNYLVVWMDVPVTHTSPPIAGIYGRRFSKSGISLDGEAYTGGIAINTAELRKWYPTVTFDGTDYLVAWNVGAYNNNLPVGIHAARVSTAGVLVEPAAESAGIPVSGIPENSAKFAHTTSASNGDGALVVWLDNVELSGEQKNIQGLFVTEYLP